MNLKTIWKVGFDDHSVAIIDRKVLVFITGQHICFQTEEGVQSYMALPSHAATTLIVHPTENIFALVEQERVNPAIYLFNYPELENFRIIKDFTELDITAVAFSETCHIAVVSGSPDNAVVLWDYKTGQRLCDRQISVNEAIKVISVCPTQWRQIALLTEHRVILLYVENCNELFVVHERTASLPARNCERGTTLQAIPLDSRTTVADESHSRAIVTNVFIPPSVIAGVSDEHYREFLESQDNEQRCRCVSHAWTETGDLLFGCEEGQLIKLITSDMKFRILINPVKNTSEELRMETPLSRRSDTEESGSLGGNLEQMVYSREGVFVAGLDGVLRLVNVGATITVDEVCHMPESSGPVTRLITNSDHRRLVIVAGQTGSMYLLNKDAETAFQTIMELEGLDPVVAVGVIAGNDNSHLASVRESGLLQIWNVENGQMLNSLLLPEGKATCMSASPLWSVVAVGTEFGCVLMIDVREPSNMRAVYRVKLHSQPVARLQYDKKSQVLVSVSNDGNAVVMSGLVSEEFRVLGMTPFEGHVLDLCVFNNPTSDEIAQVAVLSSPISLESDLKGGNKLIYFELPGCVYNDPSSYYEGINGTFEEEAIRKMWLNFETPVFGCVFGVQPIEEKSPSLFAVGVASRCLSKYQIPSKVPKKFEEVNYEEVAMLLHTHRTILPGVGQMVLNLLTTLTDAGGVSGGSLKDPGLLELVRHQNIQMQSGIGSRNSSISQGSYLTFEGNSKLGSPNQQGIDWPMLAKIRAKLSHHESLPEKFQIQLKLIDKIEEMRKAGNKASCLRPVYVFKNMEHQLPQVRLASSINNRIIVSYGAEGVVRVVDVKDDKNASSEAVHQLSMHGVAQAELTLISNFLLSGGYDGSIALLALNPTSTLLKENSNDHLMMMDRAESKMKQQNSELLSLSSLPDISPMIPEKSSSEDVYENHELSWSPAGMDGVGGGASAISGQTWSQLRVCEHQAEEDHRHHELKSHITSGIQEIRVVIRDMVTENESLDELEKIDRQEFELDVPMKLRIQEEISKEIQRVKEEIEMENLARQFTHDVIRRECWEQMSVRGRSLLSFSSTIEVTNFPLCERSTEELALVTRTVNRRCIEMADAVDRRVHTDQLAKSALNKSKTARVFFHKALSCHFEELNEENPEETDEIEDDENPDPSALSKHDLKDYETFSKIAVNVKYLYPQLELETRSQKINQIILIKDIIHQIKVAFNKEFTEVYGKKEQEMIRIQEKQGRIRRILEEIGQSELAKPDPEWSGSERPELLLTVHDDEVGVERYLTEEERRRAADAAAAEEERLRRERLDNWRERGLEDMMGGVLELRREDELKKDIAKPAFLVAGKPREEWTEEEIKINEEYERKVRELNEERDKYKKQLETEYKKLATIVDDAKTAFDETLLLLFNRQISVLMSIFQEEVKIQRLRLSLLLDELMDGRYREICELTRINNSERIKIKDTIEKTRVSINKTNEENYNLLAEERSMEKAFRKEFNDVHGAVFEHITKLYKKRPKQRGSANPAAVNPTHLAHFSRHNPYNDRPPTERLLKHMRDAMWNAVDELDKADMQTQAIDQPGLMERLFRVRRKRIDKEFDVKMKTVEIAEMEAFLERRLQDERSLENEDTRLVSLLDQLLEQRRRLQVNKEVQLVLRQGLVEVDASPGWIHDFTDAILVARTRVEKLNDDIREMGKKKVKHMTKAKNGKKRFVHLEWELKRMLMEYEDLVRKMREIQCFKITKEVQKYLASNDYDSIVNLEIQNIEKSIAELKKHQERKIDQKKGRLRSISNLTLNRLRNENEDLNNDLIDLNVQVNERRHISSGFPSDAVGHRNVELRYQKILQRQHLIDLAKSQAREVAVMRSEVERLRMRTFPALVQPR